MNITKDHINLLASYISVLNTESLLTEITNNKGFVRDFKRKTNKYRDFLEKEVTSAFKLTYKLDEDTINVLFDKMNKIIIFQKDEFIKEMLTLE